MGSGQPSVDQLRTQVTAGDHEAARASLRGLRAADADTRRSAVARLEEVAGAVTPLSSSLEPFLTDAERSVRLTTAKLFVVMAETAPSSLVEDVPMLEARLADGTEFYFVRARCGEALGYLAAEAPERSATPDILADLRMGLDGDEPELREKLAKALSYVALGDADRLSHQVSTLAAHLDDEVVLVRYHLTTALVAVGCARPSALSEGRDALLARLDDEDPFVRGRAAEALGVLRRATEEPLPTDRLEPLTDADESFTADRARFALGTLEPGTDGVADPAAIRDRTDERVAAICSTDEGTCPNCGLSLPPDAPPMCPQCGMLQ